MRPSTLAALAAARERTTALLAPLTDEQLRAQHSTLMSPLVWDLAHVAHYEELWLLRALGAGGPTDVRYDDIYDAFKHPRAERPDLDLLDVEAARAFGAEVRARALAADVPPTGDRRVAALLADDFVYGLVVRHEHQHIETMLATMQLMGRPVAAAGTGPGRAGGAGARAGRSVLVPGGPFVMGTDDDPWAYDNERPAHVVEVDPFRIDAAPTTNREYAGFVADGGYDDPRWWTAEGWKWRQEADLRAPQFWERRDGTWTRLRFGVREPVPEHEPVQHVCWYEADAYARWAGKRLPTEAEWEKAAAWNVGAGVAEHRPVPWSTAPAAGAGLWSAGRRFGPDEVGAHPAEASTAGVHDLLGGVWEWTASDFTGYPGFTSFPYREYSEVFFGDGYKVLRGGSWATDPVAVSTTFRNWDLPIRRQIFSGFRCAQDA